MAEFTANELLSTQPAFLNEQYQYSRLLNVDEIAQFKTYVTLHGQAMAERLCKRKIKPDVEGLTALFQAIEKRKRPKRLFDEKESTFEDVTMYVLACFVLAKKGKLFLKKEYEDTFFMKNPNDIWIYNRSLNKWYNSKLLGTVKSTVEQCDLKYETAELTIINPIYGVIPVRQKIYDQLNRHKINGELIRFYEDTNELPQWDENVLNM